MEAHAAEHWEDAAGDSPEVELGTPECRAVDDVEEEEGVPAAAVAADTAGVGLRMCLVLVRGRVAVVAWCHWLLQGGLTCVSRPEDGDSGGES